MDDFDRMRLAAHDIARSEAFENLSAQDINRMDMATFARLTGRLAPAETVHAARRAAEQQEQAAPQTVPEVPQAPQEQPVGRSLEELALTDENAFHAWRANRTSGGEGVGILAGNDRDAWARAAAAKAGRTGWVNTNVVESPRLEGRYLRHDDQIDHRTRAARFGSQSNSNTF